MNKKKYYIKLYKELEKEEKEVVKKYIDTLNKEDDFEDSNTIKKLINNSSQDELFRTYIVLGKEDENIGLECMAIATTIPGIDFTNKKFYCNKKDCKAPVCGKNQVWIAGYVVNKKYKDQGKGYRRDLTNRIINDVIKYNGKLYEKNLLKDTIKNIFTYLPNNKKVKRAIKCLKNKYFTLYLWDKNYLYFKKQLDIFDYYKNDYEKALEILNKTF